MDLADDVRGGYLDPVTAVVQACVLVGLVPVDPDHRPLGDGRLQCSEGPERQFDVHPEDSVVVEVPSHSNETIGAEEISI